jgi:hypothetical protein
MVEEMEIFDGRIIIYQKNILEKRCYCNWVAVGPENLATVGLRMGGEF